ncbi:Ornithine carbamoyltransferase [Bifidobacterium actinocoloniiforme DSM 22766]|uniref:Ornithine carbamoyltransferase n=1 Tax=Bifidobacterium actinocoloniiforme DSM 22766 TaxID=1437605 RepID=A0A086YZH8_9BIFI|nr:Ornithine carbamoyltransferase [Bifidobacterium actinocoloniiforme DSM 22766]
MSGTLRHFLRDDDLSQAEQRQVLELSMRFWRDRHYRTPFAGPQAVAILFDKPSTRTRSSFLIGVAEMGGYPLVIDQAGSQLGRGESVSMRPREPTASLPAPGSRWGKRTGTPRGPSLSWTTR